MNKPAEPSKAFSKLQLLVILLTPLVVMAASTGLYFSGWLVPDDRVNRGILLDPVLSLSDFGLEIEAVNPDRQWLMIQTSQACEADCRERVHTQRQIHVALGKDEPRLRRLLLTETPGLDDLEGEYPGLSVVRQDATAFSQRLYEQLPARFDDRHFVFIVDPLGNVPLYFTPENDYKDQLADLETLLELSTIG